VTPPTVGIEEEFQLVDPATRRTGDGAEEIAAAVENRGREVAAQVEREIHMSMIETASKPCETLVEIRQQVMALRTELLLAAAEQGQTLAAAGTLPLLGTHDPQVVRTDRYIQIADLHAGIVNEMSTCGTHVHVGFDDRDLAVAVMNRLRRWLPALLALSAGSPFWDGRDTGFASYRTVLWGRWPSATLPEPFESAAQYDAIVEAMITSGAVLDKGQIYWDLRLSVENPTLEFRIADVGLTVDDAVLQAGLCRALAWTERRAVEAGEPERFYRPELLRAAKWRAARYGLSDQLLDLDERTQVPAATELATLIEHVRPALEDSGDYEEIGTLVKQVLTRGNSASLQRQAYGRRGRLEDVVDMVAAATRSGIPVQS
jgi:carboxylate-amine ligase